MRDERLAFRTNGDGKTRGEIRDASKWEAPTAAIADDLRRMLREDEHLIENGIMHHKQGARCTKTALRLEWLYVELTMWRVEKMAPQRIVRGMRAEDVPRNASLPAMRRYYEMPRQLHGLWVLETRQLTLDEREYVVRKALRRLASEGYGQLGTERGHALFELCYPLPHHGEAAPPRQELLSSPGEPGHAIDDGDGASCVGAAACS